jgi:putative DNA primase/helicase
MLLVPALVTVGSLIGRSFGLRPRHHDSWIVLPNLWGMVVGRPGTLKSPALREATSHLSRLAKTEAEAFRAASLSAQTTLKVIDLRVRGIEKRASQPTTDIADLRSELERLNRERDAATPIERRYLTQDVTVEKLAEILRVNPRGILVLRDELAGWFKRLDDPSRPGDREFFLEGWNATGSYSVDRIGRGTIHLPALCISVLGTTQPTKLRQIVFGAGRGGEDGLMARFGLAVWPDSLPKWERVDRLPDSAALQGVRQLFEFLDRAEPTKLGASLLAGDVPAIPSTPEASELFWAYQTELEAELRSPALQPFPAYEAHLSKYRSLVPGLALIDHALSVAAGLRSPGALSLDSAKIAAELADVLKTHAQRIYDVHLDPGRAASRHLAEAILAGHIEDGDRVRTIYRSGWQGLGNREVVEAGLQELEGLGWVRLIKEPTPGRARTTVRIHPKILERCADDEDDEEDEDPREAFG